MRFQSLIALALEGRQEDISAVLADPANRPLCFEAVATFEELGDHANADGELQRALRYFNAATMAALILVTIPAAGEDPSLIKGPLNRVTQKAQEAKRRFDEQAHILALKPPLTTGPDPTIPPAKPRQSEGLASVKTDRRAKPWKQALEEVEALVSHGHPREAEKALSKLWSSHDDQDSGYRCVTWLEEVGDRLEAKHPEDARWYYEKLREYSASLPAETAYEGQDRAARVGAAAYKLAQVKARLPKASATIQVSLTGWGSSTGVSAESQVTSQTVADEGVLDLAPDWVFEHFRQEGDEILRPEQFPGRYRFRLMMDGAHASLGQINDQYGRSQPFLRNRRAAATDGGSAVPFRLTAGKAITIRCGVPGGGPLWTLMLTRIA